ncbi:hypothetical protein PybrP1_007781 [[Pythium] brassicae (nom. inval.)]|nr:hypothetical protein PybrP1_007781 [[Pythium] brassicae (nom. inval.)]
MAPQFPPSPSMGSSSPAPVLSRSATHGSTQWAAAKVLDRGLFRRFEEVSEELERLTRLSSQLEAPPVGGSPEIEKVRGELKRMQRSSSMVLQSQKDLQEKIARQERTTLRRFFTLNRDQKTERLKLKLCEKMAESLQIDAQLEHLERKSDSLLEDWRSSIYSSSIVASASASGSARSSGSGSGAAPDADLAGRRSELEREKQDLLRELLSAVKVPEAAQLQSRIAMCTSEVKACESAQKQVEKITAMYRRALQLLRAALAEVVADDYSGSVVDFASGPYAYTVEAGQLIEAACTFVQPESRRRYRELAPELGYVQIPKFPQVIADFARRTRTTFDPNSGLAIEAARMLETGENVIVLMHRIAIQKLDVLEHWGQAVERDHERAAKEQQRLEARLQQRLAALARSVSV